MKKTISFALLAAFSLTSVAQQLEGGTFEGDWETCVPWDSKGNTKASGTQPKGWKSSNVYTAIGAQVVVENTTGNNSDKAVILSNKELAGQKIPGYLTLGTPWATAETQFTNVRNADGGTFGGKSFTFLPDAIQFDYKRDNSKGNTETATLAAYLWKGTYTQKSVPGNTAVGFVGYGSATKVDMTDRDRNILGMATPTGGEVSKTSGAALVAKAQKSIDAAAEWTTLTVPFEYEATSEGTTTVEKINVIFSATDYFGDRNSIVAGNTLTVDNVKLLYYHALTSLTYDGTKTEVAEGTTAIDLSNVEYDATKTLIFEKKGQGATIETAYDAATAVLTVTVKGNDYEADNSSQTVYTVQFKKAAATETVQEYTNNLLLYFPTASTWTTEGDRKIKLVSTENPESHSFLLENFSFQGMELGNIQIDNLNVAEQEDGSSVYTGSQQISLLGGNITADAKVTATVKGDDMRAVIDITNATMVGEITVYFAPKVTVSPDASIAASTATGQVNVAFARTFSKGWSTLCLPFPYAVAELGDGVKVQSFESATDNSVSFAEFTGEKLAANTPYLVYFPAETSVGTTDAPKWLSATVESYVPQAVKHGEFSFTGNYEADKNMNGLYGVATVGDVQKIMLGTASATLPATAAYFTYTGTAQANAFTLNLGGTTTGIEGIEANGSADAAPVYNLQGVRVSDGSLEGLPAGVYVKGGKKVIVK